MNKRRNGDAPVRIEELDSLRGLLSIGVVFFHLYPQQLFWLWSCVDGFFVLSGFVITRLLLCNALTSTSLINFYARRAIRIWPVYFLTLGAALGLHLLYAIKNELPIESIKGVPQSLVFMQFVQFYWLPYSDYFSYDYIRWFGHSWSLAVEEQFYWLWPVVLWLTSKRPAILACVCVLLICLGIWTRSSGHLIFLLTTRIDGLAFGTMLAIYEFCAKDKAKLLLTLRPWFASACVMGAGICIALLSNIYIVPNYKADTVLSLHYHEATWLIPLFAFVFAALVACLWLYREVPCLRYLRSKPLLWLGGRSYAIYMFHPVVQAMVDRAIDRLSWPRMVGSVLTMATVVVMSHLSFVYIESRFARLRYRFPLAVA